MQFNTTHQGLQQALNIARYALVQAAARRATESPERIVELAFRNKIANSTQMREFAAQCVGMLKSIGVIGESGAVRIQLVTADEANDLFYRRRTKAKEAAWLEHKARGHAFSDAMEWAIEMLRPLSTWRLLLPQPGYADRRVELFIGDVPRARTGSGRKHNVRLAQKAQLAVVREELVYNFAKNTSSIPSAVLYYYYQQGRFFCVKDVQ